jgi:hypothetical protein
LYIYTQHAHSVTPPPHTCSREQSPVGVWNRFGRLTTASRSDSVASPEHMRTGPRQVGEDYLSVAFRSFRYPPPNLVPRAGGMVTPSPLLWHLHRSSRAKHYKNKVQQAVHERATHARTNARIHARTHSRTRARAAHTRTTHTHTHTHTHIRGFL